MYQALTEELPLDQGDILDDCPVFKLEVASSPTDLKPEPNFFHVRAVVLTQACDLAQAKADRVLVAVVHAAADLVAVGVLKAPLIRDQIRRGLVFGWYFLPTALAPIAFPESVVDLRELHTISRSILEQLIADGKRLCRIQTPWREHLGQHFGVTYSRIALPEPYETQP